MGIFRKVESGIERAFGGLFGRAFKDNVEPMELASKLAREMEERKITSVSRTYAPNRYTIFLCVDDRKNLRAFESSLREELQAHVETQARGKGYAFVGPTLVSFKTDTDLKLGEFGILAELDENVQPPVKTDPLEPEGEVPFEVRSRWGLEPLGPEAAGAALSAPLGAEEYAAGGDEVGDDLGDALREGLDHAADAGGGTPADGVREEDLAELGLWAEEPVGADDAESAPEERVGIGEPESAGDEFEEAEELEDVEEAAAPLAASATPKALETQDIPLHVAADLDLARNTIVLEQGSRSAEFHKGRVTLGRAQSADFRLDDPNVSRQHATVYWEQGRLFIKDLGSTNGTLLNGRPVTAGPVSPGDVITLGDIDVTIKTG